LVWSSYHFNQKNMGRPKKIIANDDLAEQAQDHTEDNQRAVLIPFVMWAYDADATAAGIMVERYINKLKQE
jgi:hypothetical protein